MGPGPLFSATVTGVYYIGAGPQRSVGWLGGFLRRSVLGVFCDSGRVFGYGKGGFLHQWWFSATVTGVYYIGAGRQRSGASRRHLRGRL